VPALPKDGSPDEAEAGDQRSKKTANGYRRRRAMKSTVVKRSVVVAGHKTSVSLEDAFWENLRDIAKARRVTLSDLVGGIDTNREHANLSSALRLFVLDHCQKRAASGMVVDNSVRAAEYTNVHDTDDWPNERRL
jgi:predicted DNA-binding ribbon-helix-helix protein